MTLKRLVLVALLVTALATTPVAWAGPFYTGVDVAASQEEAPGFFATLASFWQTIWNAARGQYPISGATEDPTADPTPDGGGTTTGGDHGPGLDPNDGDGGSTTP